MRDDGFYLDHILRCIERVESYTFAGKATFISDMMTQDAVARNLQILAESTPRISDSLKNSKPEVPWRNIAGFRNVMVHNYLGIDVEQVWEIVERDLPTLKVHISVLLNEMRGHS